MQTIEAIMTEDGARGCQSTTLFDFIAAFQKAATSGNGAEVVAAVLHMMEKSPMRGPTTSINPIPKGKDTISPPYIIDFQGREDSLSIRSTVARGKEVWICNGDDYNLLHHLSYLEKHRLRPHLLKSEVCDLFQCQSPEQMKGSKFISQRADSCINTFRRRMRRLGINPHKLLVPVRCIGWQLHPEVRFLQFPSGSPPSESREVYGQTMIDNMRHPAPYPGEEL